MIIEHLKALGFETEHMGGGCEALTRYWPNGTQVMVTYSDSCELPDNEHWMIGVYGSIGDTMTDELWLRSSEESPARKWKRHIAEAIDCAAAVDRLRWFDAEENAGAAVAPPAPVNGRPMVAGDLLAGAPFFTTIIMFGEGGAN